MFSGRKGVRRQVASRGLVMVVVVQLHDRCQSAQQEREERVVVDDSRASILCLLSCDSLFSCGCNQSVSERERLAEQEQQRQAAPGI